MIAEINMNYIFGIDNDGPFPDDSQEDFSGQQATELRWKKGIHITEGGRELSLRDMQFKHLENTIKYFKQLGYNTDPLEKELMKRKLS